MTANGILPRLPHLEATALVHAAPRRCALPKVDIDLVLRVESFFSAPRDAGPAVPGMRVEAVIPVHWGIDGGLVAVHSDGTLATLPLGEHPPLDVLQLGIRNLLASGQDFVAVPTVEPNAESISKGFIQMGRPVPDVVRALNARQAVLTGDRTAVDNFTSEVLGLWSGWREPVSTALIGEWATPLLSSCGRLSPEALHCLRSEARAVHRQLTPVWRRKISRSRVLLLDTPLGDGLTLYDLVDGQMRTDPAIETAFGDPRLEAVLARLAPAERAVAMAWAHPSTGTWTAAHLAGHADPEAFGERVRRKLKRLGALYTARSSAAAEAGTR